MIAKSSIVFDVKPWADDTDLGAMEKEIRTIAMEGLIWGAGKFFVVVRLALEHAQTKLLYLPRVPSFELNMFKGQ